ncbi:DUF4230 domain-containing protein [bacterium]|nr:DUF4230 domain-containing protein [bacterium]
MKESIYLLIGVLIGASLFFLFGKTTIFSTQPDIEVSVHNIIVDKVEGLGKMELVKYSFQDVVKHEVIRDWLPDPQVFLFIKGEATGCIDLTRVDSSNVVVFNDTVFINLPDPEICYAKLDHSQSRVYNTRNTFFQEAELVDAAYQKAEKHILESAVKAEVLKMTREKAESILVPIFENITGKKVVISIGKGIKTAPHN